MSRDPEDWDQFLIRDPKVLWGLVADVVKAVKAAEGERRTGRRPAVSVGSLDELYAVLFPDAYTLQPFPEAFNRLLENSSYSQHTIGPAIGYSQATISRLVSGRYPPSVETLEAIARVLDVRPTWFAEYRALKLGQLVTEVMRADPGLSAETIRQLVTS